MYLLNTGLPFAKLTVCMSNSELAGLSRMMNAYRTPFLEEASCRQSSHRMSFTTSFAKDIAAGCNSQETHCICCVVEHGRTAVNVASRKRQDTHTVRPCQNLLNCKLSRIVLYRCKLMQASHYLPVPPCCPSDAELAATNALCPTATCLAAMALR